MTVLNHADSLFVGTARADAVYAGDTKVWPAWSPKALPGLVSWLDAADYTPGAWPNRGSGAAVRIVGTPAMTVAATPLNGKPVVRFTTSEGRVRADWPYPVDDFTLIYLTRWVGPGMGRDWTVCYPPSNLLVGMHTTSFDAMYVNGGWVYGPRGGGYWPTPPSPWRMYGADSDSTGGGIGFFIDGVLMGARGTPGPGMGLSNGWGLSGYDQDLSQETMDIEVAELLLWNRRLTDPERKQAEDYLTTKWMIA